MAPCPQRSGTNRSSREDPSVTTRGSAQIACWGLMAGEVGRKDLGTSESRGNKFLESNRCWSVLRSSAMKATPEASTRLNSWLNWLRQAGEKLPNTPLSCITRSEYRAFHTTGRQGYCKSHDIFTASHDPETINCFGMKFRCRTSSTRILSQRSNFKSISSDQRGRYCPSQRLPRPTIATPNFMPCSLMVMNWTQSLQKQLVPVHAVSLYQRYPCGT